MNRRQIKQCLSDQSEEESEDELSLEFNQTLQDHDNKLIHNQPQKTVTGRNLKNIIRSRNDYCGYIKKISSFMDSFANVDNVETAIAYNIQLQKHLKVIHQRILNILTNCSLLYEQNESLLTSKILHKETIKYAARGLRCGAPFFKNRQYAFSKPNNDYLNRKYNLGEFFLFDRIYTEPRTCWLFIDKIKLLQAVKRQAIRYLENKNAVENKLKRNRVIINPASVTCKEVLETVDDNFKIDFEAISIFDLSCRHTVNKCIAMWNLYLKPSINRGKWSDEENILLYNVARKFNWCNWKAISEKISNRSEYQCFIQYQTIVGPKYSPHSFKGGRWTKEEDELLLKLVKHYSKGSITAWNTICSYFEGRTKAQIFCRYKYSINPNIQKGHFSKTEDVMIMAAVEEYGENFNEMPDKIIKGRTKIQLRNRYSNSLKENEMKVSWSLEDDKALIEWVNCHGTKKWREFSKIIKHHTRIGCRTRYQTIVKYFKENPDGQIEDIPRRTRCFTSKITKKDWRNQAITLINCTNKISSSNELVNRPSKEISEEEDYVMNRLRDQEIDFYNLFRYSYNFDFDKECKKVNCNKTNTILMWKIMNLKMKFKDINNLPPQIPHYLFADLVDGKNSKIKTILNQVTPRNHIPSNLSSLLGVRALCILAYEREKVKKLKKHDSKNKINFINAKEKFRLRFHQLFYQSAVLTRCQLPNITAVRLDIEAKKEKDFNIGFKINMEPILNKTGYKRKSTTSLQEPCSKFLKRLYSTN